MTSSCDYHQHLFFEELCGITWFRMEEHAKYRHVVTSSATTVEVSLVLNAVVPMLPSGRETFSI